jgi:hypothetical protein
VHAAQGLPCSCRQPYSKLEWEAALEEIGEIRDFDCIVDRIADEVRHMQQLQCSLSTPSAAPLAAVTHTVYVVMFSTGAGAKYPA